MLLAFAVIDHGKKIRFLKQFTDKSKPPWVTALRFQLRSNIVRFLIEKGLLTCLKLRGISPTELLKLNNYLLSTIEAGLNFKALYTNFIYYRQYIIFSCFIDYSAN